jgi:hypothetical protein
MATIPPDDIPAWAWEAALQTIGTALRDERCGTAVRFTMIGDTQLSFREAIARGIAAQRPTTIPVIGKIGA